MSQPVSILREDADRTRVSAFALPTSPVRARRGGAPATHFNHLDGIRALAACCVVLSHHVQDVYDRFGPSFWHLTYWMDFGHYAVDVFIVLSGYCLMLPVSRNHETALRSSLPEYIRRRALRILPPYFACLVLSLLVLLCIGRIREITVGDVFSHLLLIHNFNPRWVWSINPPLWSVAVEWQIYFLFPLLLLPIRKKLGNIACVSIAMLIGLAPHFLLYRSAWNMDWSYFWYIGLFAIGMTVADVTYQPVAANENTRRRIFATLCVILFAVVAWATYHNNWLYVHPYVKDTLMGGGTAFGLAWAGRHCTSPEVDPPLMVRVLASAPLVWIGSFSYSLYLVHVPVWLTMEPMVQHLHLAASGELMFRLLIGFPVALAFSYLFFLTIEKPSMQMRARKASPSPGTPGEGRGEGAFERDTLCDVRSHPRPNTLPGYRERGLERRPLTIFVQRASECLTDYFPNGDGLICYSLLSGLAQRGHMIFAYTNRDEVQARPELMEIKAHAHRIPANSLADFEHAWVAGRWLRRLETKHQIDLVWRMQPLGESCPTVPRTGGRPLVLGQLFYAWPAESVAPNDAGNPRLGFGIRRIVSPIANWGWARALRTASLVLCTTDALSEKTRSKTSGKVSTLPVIVDPPANLIADRSRPLSPSGLKLLFVANLFRNKNPLIFCQTIYHLRNLGIHATGDVLGDGPERGMMENWCSENRISDSVHFAGRVSNLEVYRHLSEADGLISTSLGEPYGRSIAEAMSVSAVPICHRSGGPADIIVNGVDGLLIDRLDGKDYAEAIQKIFNEVGAWQRIASAALQKSQQWKPAAVIDKLEDALYSVALGES